MARLIPGLVGGVLLASVTFGVGAAQSEVCVSDDQASCPPAGDVVVDPSLATDAALPDTQTPPAVTRTLGPPTVVQPFAGVAAAAAQADQVAPAGIVPDDQQKLPPGPPSRLP